MSEKKLAEAMPDYTAEPEFWDADCYDCIRDTESLIHTDPDEAVEAYLDERCDAPLPATVKVTAFKRRKLGPRDANPEWILESLLEQLDDEYGNPDEGTDPTPAMKAAAEAFAEAIRREYVVWTCEAVATATVDVKAWERRYAPGWLPSPAASSAGEPR